MAIKFFLPEPLYSAIPEPVPATSSFPDWYSNTSFNIRDEFGESHTKKTIRGCMPFLDAMSMGWILRAPQDLSIRSKNGSINFEHGDVSDDVVPVRHFGPGTLTDTPKNLPTGIIPIKLNAYWYIDGHTGSKAWIMPPRNRFQKAEYNDLVFTSGIYNIDSTYVDSGILAFLDPTNDVNIHIRAGTPLAQVVFLDDTGLINEASVEKMNDDMKREKEISDTRREVNQNFYKEEHWEPIGRARPHEDGGGSACPFGFGGDE